MGPLKIGHGGSQIMGAPRQNERGLTRPHFVARVKAHGISGAMTEEDAAYAKLLAASPDLLDALKFALEVLREADARVGYHPDSLRAIRMEDAITGARAAINKAEGRK